MAFAAAASAATINGDLRIATDTVLLEDTTVSGSIIVHPDATLDLNGHDLTAGGIRGATIYEDGDGVKYERLDYIESDGTQYIITDFTPAAGDRAEIQIAYTAESEDYTGIFSTRDSTGGNGFCLWRTGSLSGGFNLRADYGTYNGERFLNGLGDNMKSSAGIRRIIMNSGWPGNGKYSVVLTKEDGTSIASTDKTGNLAAGPYSPAGPLVLMTNGKWNNRTFTPGTDSSRTVFNAKLRFYWLKFDKDGAKCTICPVRRLSDGVLGAFNTVTKRFLPPATGTFTKCGEHPGTEGGEVVNSCGADLTTADASRVTQTGKLYSGDYSMSTLFNNNFTMQTDSTHRILAYAEDLPVKADYDFGDGTPQIVNAYRFVFGQSADNITRAPKAWKFFGANDPAAKGGDDSLWTLLDERTDETLWGTSEQRVYTFVNDTSYRFYRISFEASGNDKYLELIQVEYFRTVRLRLDVPQGKTAVNAGAAVNGAVRLVKDGSGIFTASKRCLYNGGTEIRGGTLKCGLHGIDRPLGSSTAEVAVHSGGMLEMDGWVDFQDYRFVLAGGILQNSATPRANVANPHWNPYLKYVTLAADSRMNIYRHYGFIADDYKATKLDLGGFTLTAQVAGGNSLYFFGTTITNGTLDVETGGWIELGWDGAKICEVDARTANIAMGGALNAHRGDTPVRDYTAKCSADYNMGDRMFKVYGVFTPAAGGYFHGCEMQDGSAIDFTRRTEPLNTVSSFTGGSKTLSFADGTVKVKIDPAAAWVKTLAKSKGRLVDWSAGVAPGANVEFALDAGGDTRYKIRRSADGNGLDLYLTPGFAVIVR